MNWKKCFLSLVILGFVLSLVILSGCDAVKDVAEKEAKKLVCKDKLDRCSGFCEKWGDFKICHDLCNGDYERCIG